jgi:hypothetical protein
MEQVGRGKDSFVLVQLNACTMDENIAAGLFPAMAQATSGRANSDAHTRSKETASIKSHGLPRLLVAHHA